MSNQERLQKFVEEKKKHLRNAIVYKNKMIEYQKKGDTKNAEKSKEKLMQELARAKRYKNLISQQNAILLNSERASRDPEFRAQWLKSIETAVSKSRARHEIDNDSDSENGSDKEELEELSNNDECAINSPKHTPTVSSLPNSNGLTTTKGKLWLKKLWSAISCSGGGGKKSKKYKKYNKKTRRAKKYKKTKKQKNKFAQKMTRSKKY
jgi:hypothetical protein